MQLSIRVVERSPLLDDPQWQLDSRGLPSGFMVSDDYGPLESVLLEAKQRPYLIAAMAGAIGGAAGGAAAKLVDLVVELAKWLIASPR